jgi:hypothetical protein
MMTRPRPKRFRCIAKSLGTILSGLVFASWALSVFPIRDRTLAIQLRCDNDGFDLRLGTVQLRFPRDLRDSVFGQNHYHYYDVGWRTTLFSRRDWSDYGLRNPTGSWMRRPGEGCELLIPLWLPLFALAIPTSILWHHDRRRPRLGHCPACNYNLTGNTSGICPECGTACRVATVKD